MGVYPYLTVCIYCRQSTLSSSEGFLRLCVNRGARTMTLVFHTEKRSLALEMETSIHPSILFIFIYFRIMVQIICTFFGQSRDMLNFIFNAKFHFQC